MIDNRAKNIVTYRKGCPSVSEKLHMASTLIKVNDVAYAF